MLTALVVGLAAVAVIGLMLQAPADAPADDCEPHPADRRWTCTSATWRKPTRSSRIAASITVVSQGPEPDGVPRVACGR